ncbi:hypothetical protein GTW25_07230 [Aliihoeflea aestuarii]|uniref:hypothetical protein n=1 Tax=Aliihoeflea aestuarii TaxID=453840 RepID=UPI002092E491|nr:hypothetical protein [Aliihoeflea aestuarii]MCO6390820.1 hypothetical protein [Aliihoeflea aestuarii]
MTNEIRIGIVCNADFRDRLDAALADADPRLQFEVRCYAHQEEASGYAAELEPIVDAILFSGPVPYYISLEERGALSVPADFVVYDEVSLLKAFFDLASRNTDLSTISVDTISTATVRDVCGEIGIDPSGIRTMPLVEGGIHDDFASFHIENYRSGRTTHALTCRSVVKAKLDEAGIPCHFMFWTKHTILKALDLLVSRYIQARYRGSQIAVGLLRVGIPSVNASIAETRRMALEMESQLLESADRLGVHLVDIGNGLHLFYSTYGALKTQTQDFTTAPYFQSSPQLGNYSFQMGIGTGPSAAIAEEGARKALYRAELDQNDSVFVVFDNDRLIGPLGAGSSSRIIRVADVEITRLADRIGITSANLARILEALETDRNANYSAIELARILDTTSRTARRVLARLAEAGFARSVGESVAVGQGRPATLYRIDMSSRDGAVQ